jgi:hypothetical protein
VDSYGSGPPCQGVPCSASRPDASENRPRATGSRQWAIPDPENPGPVRPVPGFYSRAAPSRVPRVTGPACACRGVHFAITEQQAERLLGAEDDEQLVAIVGEIEDEWDLAYETDKAWDALHRCLSNGTLSSGEGEPPLNRVFFGGNTLNQEDDYFVVLVTPAQVKEIAIALASVTEPWLRRRYFDVDFPYYQGEKSEDDWQYALGYFELLPDFFARAASAERCVIFTVSQ